MSRSSNGAMNLIVRELFRRLSAQLVQYSDYEGFVDIADVLNLSRQFFPNVVITQDDIVDCALGRSQEFMLKIEPQSRAVLIKCISI